MPRVTVIIPTYNWCSVLPYAVGSVLDQSFTDFELLVVGDGCTDDSETYVESVVDSRVRWVNLESNSGDQAGPCNRGCAEARGEWIAYLGHDDLWLPRHLETLVGLMELGCDMVYSIAVCYRENEVCGALPSLFEDYQRPMAIGPTSVMHRKELIDRVGGWRNRYNARAAMDYDLWQRFHAAGAIMRFVSIITAVKFPAVLRKNVYRTKPNELQAKFLNRIRHQPDFERIELIRLLVKLQNEINTPTTLVRTFLALSNLVRAKLKLGQRLGLPSGRKIDAIRRYKGLR